MTQPFEGIKKLLESQAAEDKSEELQTLVLNGSNIISFPDSSYTMEALGEKVIVSVDVFRDGLECKDCDGRGKVETKGEFVPGEGRKVNYTPCTSCKGVGRSIILLKESKIQPTTGVVVSMGHIAQEKASYKLGDRILFGAYAGDMIPTKFGLAFKCLDWNLAKAIIRGADGLNAFDFIIQENS